MFTTSLIVDVFIIFFIIFLFFFTGDKIFVLAIKCEITPFPWGRRLNVTLKWNGKERGMEEV